MSTFIKIGTKWGHNGPRLKQIVLDHSKFIFVAEQGHRFYSVKETDKNSLLINNDTIFALAEGFDIFALAVAKNQTASSFSNSVGIDTFAQSLEDSGVDYDGVWWVDAKIYPLNEIINYPNQIGVCQINSGEVINKLSSAWEALKTTEPLKKK